MRKEKIDYIKKCLENFDDNKLHKIFQKCAELENEDVENQQVIPYPDWDIIYTEYQRAIPAIQPMYMDKSSYDKHVYGKNGSYMGDIATCDLGNQKVLK